MCGRARDERKLNFEKKEYIYPAEYFRELLIDRYKGWKFKEESK